MRRHLRTSRVQSPPAGPGMPATSWKLTLILAVMAGISIGAALRLVRDERILREKALEAPEASLRYADPREGSGEGLGHHLTPERAKYATFEEAMGLRDTKNGPKFVW